MTEQEEWENNPALTADPDQLFKQQIPQIYTEIIQIWNQEQQEEQENSARKPGCGMITKANWE